MERSEQNADILYEDLKKNIMDVIKESQIKLGFEKNPVTIYYPIEALNHLLDTDLGEEQMDQCLQNFAKKVKDPLGEVVFQRNKSRYGITVQVQGVCYIDRNVTDNGFLRDLLELLRRHDCNKEQILAVFKKYSDQIRVQDVTDNDFDYAVWFENDANNIYRYCFHEEEGHVIYHRFTPREYQALMPLEM